MNLRIAELVKELKPDEITEVLSGPGASLLRLSDQQQQQQQQQTRRAAQGPSLSAPE